LYCYDLKPLKLSVFFNCYMVVLLPLHSIVISWIGLIMSFYYALLVISIFLFWFLFFFQTEALKQTNSLALFLLSLAI